MIVNLENRSVLLIIISLVLSCNLMAQGQVYENTFVRIYDFKGRKIHKGRIKSITHNTIELKGNSTKIHLKQIGKIRTKHDGFNNLGLGTLIGGALLASTFYMSGDDEGGFINFSAETKAFIGLYLGTQVGFVVGGITAIFKGSDCYKIYGNEKKFENFRNNMQVWEETNPNH